jgi:hypothetical protein
MVASMQLVFYFPIRDIKNVNGLNQGFLYIVFSINSFKGEGNASRN